MSGYRRCEYWPGGERGKRRSTPFSCVICHSYVVLALSALPESPSARVPVAPCRRRNAGRPQPPARTGPRRSDRPRAQTDGSWHPRDTPPGRRSDTCRSPATHRSSIASVSSSHRVATGHAGGGHARDLPLEVEVATQQIAEVLPLEPPDRAFVQPLDGRDPRNIPQERDLPKKVAGLEDANPPAASLLPNQHLQTPLTDDVEGVPRVALLNDHVARYEVLDLELHRQQIELT